MPAAAAKGEASAAAANGEGSAAPPGCWVGAAAKGEGPMLGCRAGAAAKGEAPAASLGCRTGAAAKGEAPVAPQGCCAGAAANGDASAAAAKGDASLALLWAPALPLAAAWWAAGAGQSSTGPETCGLGISLALEPISGRPTSGCRKGGRWEGAKGSAEQCVHAPISLCTCSSTSRDTYTSRTSSTQHSSPAAKTARSRWATASMVGRWAGSRAQQDSMRATYSAY